MGESTAPYQSLFLRFSGKSFCLIITCMTKKIEAGIYIVPGRKVWPHEIHVAEVLALAGYYVEFLEETSLPTPDIKLNGVQH